MIPFLAGSFALVLALIVARAISAGADEARAAPLVHRDHEGWIVIEDDGSDY